MSEYLVWIADQYLARRVFSGMEKKQFSNCMFQVEGT